MLCCTVVLIPQEYQHLTGHPDMLQATTSVEIWFMAACPQAVAPVIGYKKRPLEEATHKLDQLAKQ